MAKASFSRHPLAIAMGVVALHVGGLAALQSGLLVRAYELVVPVEMISQIIEPPQPIAPAPPPPAPAQTEVAKSKSISPPPAPQPLAIADPSPAPNAPMGAVAAPAPLPPISAPVAMAPSAAPAPALAPAPAPKIELPRADADYLNNPKPPYPPVSKRMGEQGRVVVRVYVGEDGQPQKAELRTSSGFDRLDATAVATVMRWRFRPGMRGASPEAMWVNVPIDFTLDN